MKPSKPDPPKFDRLAVKREILKASDDRKIPPLSYIHFESVDPEPNVDSFLIEALEDGALEGGLTNQLFFELLAESPDYLAFEPVRKRIKEWQETLYDPGSSKDAHDQAKDNLNKIGNVLAMESRGRPLHDLPPGFLLRLERDRMQTALEAFLTEIKTLGPTAKVMAFKDKFPFWADHTGLLKKHHSSLELAKAIMSKKYGVSKRQLLYSLAE
jgi:hypothetical protein